MIAAQMFDLTPGDLLHIQPQMSHSTPASKWAKLQRSTHWNRPPCGW
jgi:hypothetical protein